MADPNQENNSAQQPALDMATSKSFSSMASPKNVEECDITDCTAVQQINDALLFYQDLGKEHKPAAVDERIIKYFAEHPNVINDYHHILLHHLSTGNKSRDNKNFSDIHSLFRQQIQCDIKNCVKYKRNHRDRQKEGATPSQYQESELMNQAFQLQHDGDPKARFYKEFLDSVHCYFIHSVDVGFRMQFDEANDNQVDEHKFNDDTNRDNKHEDESKIDLESPDFYQDTEIEKITAYIKSKREEMNIIRGLNRVKNNKFSTALSKENLEKQKLEAQPEGQEEAETKQPSDDDNKAPAAGDGATTTAATAATAAVSASEEESKQSDMLLYSFGYRYYYWDSYKTDEDTKSWFIPKKYSSFQQEILNEIPKKQYDDIVTKAETMLTVDVIKQMGSYVTLSYGIKMGEPIRKEHLMSVVLYTDFDKLSTKFSATFRKIATDKSVEDTKRRNEEYREWSRILRETVECYGTTVQESKIQIFYHGVSMIYFDSFTAKFCCPTSTTAQMEVAMNFADSNGLILVLERLSGFESLRYFNCTLLSVFGYEDERLFFGGKQPLQFRSIRTMQQNHNYWHFVKALSLFDKIIAGQLLNDEAEIKKVVKMDHQVINRLIKHEIGEKSNKFPEYINKCFKGFVTNKKKIKFNLEGMVQHYPGFIGIFMDKTHSHYFLDDKDNNLLAFDYIAKIFKQCEEIHSIRTDPAHNVFNGQGFMYLDSLVPILKRVNENKESQLKRIRIFGRNDLNDTDMYNNFEIYILDKTGWSLKRQDNQVIITRN